MSPPSIPVVDLARRGQRFARAFAAIAERVASSGTVLLGPEMERFELEFAEFVGTSRVVAVSSGAAALQLALAAAGVGAGDEVLVPAFTAVPTASAVMAVGARPVAVDVDPDTACVTPDVIDVATRRGARAVVAVHLYGFPVEIGGGSASRSSPIVIEDAAQASGALHGCRGAAAAYSFYPTKNLGGIGDGGAVATDSAELADVVRRLRVHGMTEQYLHTEISQNFRMSELEAAWLSLGLATLAADVAARRRVADAYRRAAPQLRWQAAHASHAYHLCVFRSAARDEVRRALGAAGVSTAVHYPRALTQQPAYAEIFDTPCPEAEAWAAECVSLPCFAEMTDQEIEQVAGALAALPAS